MIDRIAVLADIHGNALALEAVLADARRLGATRLFNLGDVLYGPLEPRRTFELLRDAGVEATISGNQDRLIARADDAVLAANATLRFVMEELGPEPVEWLRSLPQTATLGDELLLFHGTPASDTTYLLEDVSSGRPVVRPDAEIRETLGETRETVLLCGHTHVARLVSLSDGRMIVNPGSVGLPAYDDDTLVPHFMESYSPHAEYAMIERIACGWTVSFHRVPYDHLAAAAQARALGREDWARGISAGRMD